MDIKNWWIKEHDYVMKIAEHSKTTGRVLLDMYERYDALTDLEKEDINILLVDWINNSGVENINNDRLYTALAFATEYSIFSAMPAMHKLCDRLKDCKIPENPQGFNEREHILYKLQELNKIKNNSKLHNQNT